MISKPSRTPVFRLFLWHKLLLYFAASLLVLAGLLAVAHWSSLRESQTNIQRNSEILLSQWTDQYLESLVREQVRLVEARLGRARVAARILSTMTANALATESVDESSDALPDIISDVLADTYRSMDVEGMLYVHAQDGKLWSYPLYKDPGAQHRIDSPREAHRMPQPTHTDVVGAEEPGAPQAFWTAIHESHNSENYELVIDAVAPIQKDGQVWGYAGVSVSLPNLIAELNQHSVLPGSYTFIMDSQRQLVGAPPPARLELASRDSFQPRGVISLSRSATADLDEALDQMARGATAVRQVQLVRDRKYVAYRPLSSIDWRLGLAVSQTIASSESIKLATAIHDASRTSLTSIVIATGVFVLVVLLLGAILLRRLVAPVRQMTAFTNAMVSGDYSRRVEASTDDELGQLGRDFNAMAEHIERLVTDLQTRAAELRRANDSLQQQTEILQWVLHSIGDGVIVADENGEFLLWNDEAERLVGVSFDTSSKKMEWLPQYGFFHSDRTTHYHADELPLQRALRGESLDDEEMFLRNPNVPDGAWLMVTARPLQDAANALRGGVVVYRDITATKLAVDELERRVEERSAELREAQRQLIEAAHQAGMAEVATNILHNVGNVLNSVNISTQIVHDRLRSSRLNTLTKLAELLKEHEHDLPRFLTEDKSGKFIPVYIGKLAQHADEERAFLLGELDSLSKNIEHIKHIVSLQQSYAGTSKVIESVTLDDLIEDAVRINGSGFNRLGIEIVREFDENIPPVDIDKHKLLQIMVNLVSNAKHALAASQKPTKQLLMRLLRPDKDMVRIEVTDNGVGISEDNMRRIFYHRFTTRKDGHGFGLHGSAIAAKEMGISLRAHSDGPGHGATFIIEIPTNVQPEQ